MEESAQSLSGSQASWAPPDLTIPEPNQPKIDTFFTQSQKRPSQPTGSQAGPAHATSNPFGAIRDAVTADVPATPEEYPPFFVDERHAQKAMDPPKPSVRAEDFDLDFGQGSEPGSEFHTAQNSPESPTDDSLDTANATYESDPTLAIISESTAEQVSSSTNSEQATPFQPKRVSLSYTPWAYENSVAQERTSTQRSRRSSEVGSQHFRQSEAAVMQQSVVPRASEPSPAQDSELTTIKLQQVMFEPEVQTATPFQESSARSTPHSPYFQQSESSPGFSYVQSGLRETPPAQEGSRHESQAPPGQTYTFQASQPEQRPASCQSQLQISQGVLSGHSSRRVSESGQPEQTLEITAETTSQELYSIRRASQADSSGLKPGISLVTPDQARASQQASRRVSQAANQSGSQFHASQQTAISHHSSRRVSSIEKPIPTPKIKLVTPEEATTSASQHAPVSGTKPVSTTSREQSSARPRSSRLAEMRRKKEEEQERLDAEKAATESEASANKQASRRKTPKPKSSRKMPRSKSVKAFDQSNEKSKEKPAPRSRSAKKPAKTKIPQISERNQSKPKAQTNSSPTTNEPARQKANRKSATAVAHEQTIKYAKKEIKLTPKEKEIAKNISEKMTGKVGGKGRSTSTTAADRRIKQKAKRPAPTRRGNKK